MDTNRVIGALLAVTGLMDLVWARALAARLTPAARMGLLAFGIVFLLVGGAMLLGLVRAV